MATTDPTRRNPAFIALVSILTLVAAIFLILRLMAPPQMGTDEEVFKTVDALFTALTSRDVKRLEDCEQRLRTYREAGTLPASAAKSLDAIVKQAHAGDWKSSSERLYYFMLAQQRDSK